MTRSLRRTARKCRVKSKELTEIFNKMDRLEKKDLELLAFLFLQIANLNLETVIRMLVKPCSLFGLTLTEQVGPLLFDTDSSNRLIKDATKYFVQRPLNEEDLSRLILDLDRLERKEPDAPLQ